MVIRWRRLAVNFVTTRNKKPATANPKATTEKISTGIREAEVVIPVALVVDALSRVVLFASSDTVVSAVGRVNSVRISLESAVGSCAMTLATGGSGHAGTDA